MQQISNEKKKMQQDPDCRTIVFGENKLVLEINKQRTALQWFVFVDGDRYAFKVTDIIVTNVKETEIADLQIRYIPDGSVIVNNGATEEVYAVEDAVPTDKRVFFAFILKGYAEFIGIHGGYEDARLFYSTKLEKRLAAFVPHLLMLISAYDADIADKIKCEVAGGKKE